MTVENGSGGQTSHQHLVIPLTGPSMCHACQVVWEDTISEMSATVLPNPFLQTDDISASACELFSRTVASAFFKPTTWGEVGGHASWSRHCFNLSLSDVSELRADFMVACTVATREKEGAL